MGISDSWTTSVHLAQVGPKTDVTNCSQVESRSLAERTRILYNHIYFSDLSVSHKRAILEGHRYEQILRHQNYNPRIIDHMTQARNLAHVSASAYFESFVENLTNPARIWDHAFRNQLTEAAQHVLLALASLPDEVLVSDLEITFNALYQYRRARLGFRTSSRDFEHALKELDGNFIKTELAGDALIVVFHNPSVQDFLESYLDASATEVADLIESAFFFDQFIRLWRGCRGKRFGGVETYGQEFLRALVQKINAPIARAFRLTDWKGDVIGTRRQDRSFEARISFVVEVAGELSTAESLAALGPLLTSLLDRIRAGNPDRQDLVRLLKDLSSNQLKSDSALFDAAKDCLTQGLEDYEDFDAIREFVKSFPNTLLAADIERIGEEFEGFCEGYVDNSFGDDPDTLRTVADEIIAVGRQLGVDVDRFAERLVERAHEAELEGNREGYEPDDSDERWRDSSREHEGVEEMFQGLLVV